MSGSLRRAKSPPTRTLATWVAVGIAGYVLLPWYALDGTVVSPQWLAHFREIDDAPALLQAAPPPEMTARANAASCHAA